jgi:hypothetical protein
METLCKDCIFRKNDSNNNQFGCEMGHVEKLQNKEDYQNKPFIEEINDVNGNYFQINSLCRDIRDVNWLNKNGHSDVNLNNIEELKALIKEDNKKLFDVFFEYNGDTKDSMLARLSGLLTSKYKHRMLHIIFNDTNLSKVDIINSLRYSNIGRWNVIRSYDSFELECIKQIESKKVHWAYIVKGDAAIPDFEGEFNIVNSYDDNDTTYKMVFESDNSIIFLKYLYIALINITKQKITNKDISLSFHGKETNVSIFDGSIASLVEYAKDAGIYGAI